MIPATAPQMMMVTVDKPCLLGGFSLTRMLSSAWPVPRALLTRQMKSC